ncbi:MAG: DNA-binding protein WhiA, partial [Clostridia bacterium]|nr:DNA-binding protein WhiA [Clostridia bacterium]
AALEIMNKKIRKAIRNETNRIVNCETSNLAKTVSAAQECINAIVELKKNGQFVALPEELRETAELRLQHSEANLTQLASLHIPPISKSGVNHRIKKIIEFSKK